MEVSFWELAWQTEPISVDVHTHGHLAAHASVQEVAGLPFSGLWCRWVASEDVPRKVRADEREERRRCHGGNQILKHLACEHHNIPLTPQPLPMQAQEAINTLRQCLREEHSLKLDFMSTVMKHVSSFLHGSALAHTATICHSSIFSEDATLPVYTSKENTFLFQASPTFVGLAR